MLRKQIPSPNTIFTFEVVARLASFSNAARELNVTQPAISRSISSLENHLGYQLFKRHGRWIGLTENGEKLFRATSTAFNTINDTLRDIEQLQESRETITISMSATAVNYWFLPRMSAFKEQFPEVSLSFQEFTQNHDDRLRNVDLSIRLSSADDADMHRWPFCDEKILALCSPEYRLQNGTLDRPRAGKTHSLIDMLDQQYSLDEFFHATGQGMPDNPSMVKFSDYSSTMQAIIEGHGIALIWIAEASLQIIQGKLVPACKQIVNTGRRYHILASNLTPMRAIAKDIRDWLVKEMQNDQKQLADMMEENW